MYQCFLLTYFSMSGLASRLNYDEMIVTNDEGKNLLMRKMMIRN